MLEWTQQILRIGEAFSGAECTSLRDVLSRQSGKFFDAFHEANLQVRPNFELKWVSRCGSHEVLIATPQTILLKVRMPCFSALHHSLHTVTQEPSLHQSEGAQYFCRYRLQGCMFSNSSAHAHICCIHMYCPFLGKFAMLGKGLPCMHQVSA